MTDRSNREQAVESLEKLGLKEYEARCFVALSRLSTGTAKEISEISDVPRTRVYDAVRVLESRGLVEVQHSNPQQFRAVDVETAAAVLRAEHESRTERLVSALSGVEPVCFDGDAESEEVWSLSGETAIRNRVCELAEEASEELVLIVGPGASIGDELVERLRTAAAGCDVLVGVHDVDLQDALRDALADANALIADFPWPTEGPVTIGYLLLVDRDALLVSAVGPSPEGGEAERAVCGRGCRNGAVVIARRLLSIELGDQFDSGIG